MIVLDKNGLQGTFDELERTSANGSSHVLIRFQSGQQVAVPREMLIQQADGRYTLKVSVEELMAVHGEGNGQEIGQEIVIPVVEEIATVQKRAVEAGTVEIRKTVHERTEVIDVPLHSEEVEIERVNVNRIVDEPVQVRHEGDTMIIPLLEEVLVVEKKLVLREEVHVKRVRKEVHESREVTLREERVEVARRPGMDQES
jgi:uncharacterized protein (TIGR02271 family)